MDWNVGGYITDHEGYALVSFIVALDVLLKTVRDRHLDGMFDLFDGHGLQCGTLTEVGAEH